MSIAEFPNNSGRSRNAPAEFERTPPQDVIAEQSVLGGMLLSKDAISDVVTVKDGYGRNFLLPRGNAIVWSKGGEGQIDGIKRARTAREIRDLDHAKEIKNKFLS